MARVLIFFSLLSVLFGLEWKEFEVIEGKCKVSFPVLPQHVQDRLPVIDTKDSLQYDVYVSEWENKLFLMMVATFPMELTQEQEIVSLQGFLNGLLQGNNQLVAVDLVLVDGHQALDFFLHSEGRYFKGRAFLAESKLYLLALETQNKEADELFAQFVGSFSFVK